MNTLLNCVRLKSIKAIKLTVAWSLNCIYIIVCVALSCPGKLTNTVVYNEDYELRAPIDGPAVLL